MENVVGTAATGHRGTEETQPVGDEQALSLCSSLADRIAQTHETIARLVRRAVDLRRRLEPLECQPTPDLVEMEAVRTELADVTSQLTAAKAALVALEQDYNLAGCPTLG